LYNVIVLQVATMLLRATVIGETLRPLRDGFAAEAGETVAYSLEAERQAVTRMMMTTSPQRHAHNTSLSASLSLSQTLDGMDGGEEEDDDIHSLTRRLQSTGGGASEAGGLGSGGVSPSNNKRTRRLLQPPPRIITQGLTVARGSARMRTLGRQGGGSARTPTNADNPRPAFMGDTGDLDRSGTVEDVVATDGSGATPLPYRPSPRTPRSPAAVLSLARLSSPGMTQMRRRALRTRATSSFDQTIEEMGLTVKIQNMAEEAENFEEE
jgi:hypothetical protein